MSDGSIISVAIRKKEGLMKLLKSKNRRLITFGNDSISLGNNKIEYLLSSLIIVL